MRLGLRISHLAIPVVVGLLVAHGFGHPADRSGMPTAQPPQPPVQSVQSAQQAPVQHHIVDTISCNKFLPNSNFDKHVTLAIDESIKWINDAKKMLEAVIKEVEHDDIVQRQLADAHIDLDWSLFNFQQDGTGVQSTSMSQQPSKTTRNSPSAGKLNQNSKSEERGQPTKKVKTSSRHPFNTDTTKNANVVPNLTPSGSSSRITRRSPNPPSDPNPSDMSNLSDQLGRMHTSQEDHDMLRNFAVKQLLNVHFSWWKSDQIRHIIRRSFAPYWLIMTNV